MVNKIFQDNNEAHQEILLKLVEVQLQLKEINSKLPALSKQPHAKDFVSSKHN